MKLKDVKKTPAVEPIKLTPNKSVLASSPAPEAKTPAATPKPASSPAPKAAATSEGDHVGRKSAKDPNAVYERIGAEIKADNKKLINIATAMGDFKDPSRALDYAIEMAFGKKYGKLLD